MRFYAVYTADVVDSVRALAARTARRKSGVLWFALLFGGSVWLVLLVAEASLDVGLPPGLDLTPGALLFLAFFVSLAKGAVDAYHRAIRPDALVHLLAQPMSRRAVALGKFFTVLWFNLAFVAAALALAVAFVNVGRMHVPLDGAFAADLVLAVVAGLASGFALAVLGSLSTWRRKAAGLSAYAPVIGTVYALLGPANPSPIDALPALVAVTALALVAVVACASLLLEAWNNQTSGRRRTRPSAPFLRFSDPKLSALVDAELRTMARKRQLALSLATVVILGIASVVLYGILGPPSLLPRRYADLFYPIVVAALAYIAAATQLAVPGMAALGKELDRLWILKSHPVRGAIVYRAKTVAIAMLTPAILVVVVLPLPLAAGFSLAATSFLLLTSLAVCLALLALGLRVGARRPNFDPNTQGLPDSIEMYNAFLAALVLAFVVVSLPAAVYRFDHVLGVLAAILVADLAALSIVLTSRSAAVRYEAIEA